MALDELRSNLYYLCAHLMVWIVCLATIAAACIVAEMREYDPHTTELADGQLTGGV